MACKFIMFSCFIFASFLNYGSGSYIPTFLWNIKGSALDFQPVSAFAKDSGKFAADLQNILQDEGTGIVAFVIDQLCMEDISCSDKAPGSTLQMLESFLDKRPHSLLPSVNEPVKHLLGSPCDVEEIKIDETNYKQMDKLIASHLENSCVVVVHLPDTQVYQGSGQLFSPAFKTSKKNIVGVFTGAKSSWDSSNEIHRNARSLMAVEDDPSDHFINYTGCIIMYIESATLVIGDKGNDTVSLNFPPKFSGVCDNSSELTLTFGAANDVSEVTVIFSFTKGFNAWTIGDTTVTVKGGKGPQEDLVMLHPTVDVPLGFSYSCGHFAIKDRNASIPIALKFGRFQVQPFEVNGVFASSFDCVSFFTLPIWMGIFITLLFVVILNTGIYALFNIKTMDRFDDPKGKTISVPVGTE